jgi:hypothetical protein
MKLGYFAPMPPAPTGVAQYAAVLLTQLEKRFEIATDADANLYQVGNNPLHWEIYQRAIAKPGVVLLHDACLHHLLLGQLTRERYVEEFVYNYGEWFRQTAERYWEGRAMSGADTRYFERPMLKRLCQGARLVVVHNRAAEAAVLSHVPQVPVVVLPHLFEAPRDHFYREVDVYRDQVLGVPRDHCLFAVLGHLRESKRVDVVLRVFEALRGKGLKIGLLVQGSFVGPDLERALGQRLKADGIVRRGYLSEQEWWMQAHALDVAINLRWPLAGESSGIATRLMGIAKPVIVTRSLETDDLPEAACIKVDPGLAEREELERFVAWLTLNVEARRAVGRHAAIHTQHLHGIERVGALLEDSVRAAFDAGGHAALS